MLMLPLLPPLRPAPLDTADDPDSDQCLSLSAQHHPQRGLYLMTAKLLTFHTVALLEPSAMRRQSDSLRVHSRPPSFPTAGVSAQGTTALANRRLVLVDRA